ncbi:cytochrome c biogenesis protein CcdA [Afipia sp. 1NLS2]|uniref:cytochrome c biogenesis CcdA family protein n=1 Tax=Afipia sp. 1NLS2 TaxID=666684 RepID=UPI0001D9F50E|nr:cytochrome c biogenesis protein CcdA [Afipia sp. 1NLS2]EFI53034.1 cytochrome c biogenesis protein transmembrane region [Afipia sp. 1NLS2]
MIDLNSQMQDIAALTPFTVALAMLAGLVVGVAPSSFPLISVATGFAAGQGATESGSRHFGGLRLSIGFVLGIATVDAVLGALFGLFGFAVLRVLASYLALAYLLLAVIMIVVGLALLRFVHIVIPTLAPSSKPTHNLVGSYLLGIPFGLSTCPGCTPLLLPVAAAAAGTADPLLGAALMGAFGLARGIPIIVVATMAGRLASFRHTHRFTLWAERIGAALMFVSALYFFYQAALYGGWVRP